MKLSNPLVIAVLAVPLYVVVPVASLWFFDLFFSRTVAAYASYGFWWMFFTVLGGWLSLKQRRKRREKGFKANQ